MGLLEVKDFSAETVAEQEEVEKEMGFLESVLNKQGNETKYKKKIERNFLARKFGCLRFNDDDVSAAEKPDVNGSFNVEAGGEGTDHVPTHLVVMVNGIIGSAQNWRYAAKKFVKAYPDDVLVHCSESNSSMLTFDGIDVMGKRLADEVISVVHHHPNLQKISFVAHSLGGLVARYAVAKLYEQDSMRNHYKKKGGCARDESHIPFIEEMGMGKIVGLIPVNFITVATPHLGSRGHKQVPVFCGLHSIEKGASFASGLLGRTGRHLFLRDHENGNPPLVLEMSNDTEDLKFISALQSFDRRIAYANTSFDHLVGWSSSSLRRRSELPKRRDLLKHAKYPHIVVASETQKKANPREEASNKAKVSKSQTSEMEETMITGLTKLTWERVDVSFKGSIQRLLAHNTIQVKTYWMNYHGADVIQYMIDNFQL